MKEYSLHHAKIAASSRTKHRAMVNLLFAVLVGFLFLTWVEIINNEWK